MTKTCPICGEKFKTSCATRMYCSEACRHEAARKRQEENGGYRATRLEKPYVEHKPKYVTHIDEINAEAKRRGISYGKLRAEKLIAKQHEEMTGEMG